jgi:peptidoglycan-N-acetylglucosamine deacetylase
MIVTVFCLGVVLAAYFMAPWLWGRYLRYGLLRQVRRQGSLCITFDDGPGNRLTPRILDILAEHGVQATFFLLGRNIAGREDLVRRIAAEGHDVGSHGFDHLHAWKVPPWRSIRNIETGWQAIDAALGTRRGTYPFRPPYGKLNLAMLLYLWARRAPIVYWTVDSGDTWSRDRRQTRLNRPELRMRQGAVVLVHDFDRTRNEIDEYVLHTVQQCIAVARESRLKLCSCSQLDGAMQ